MYLEVENNFLIKILEIKTEIVKAYNRNVPKHSLKEYIMKWYKLFSTSTIIKSKISFFIIIFNFN